MNVVIVIVAIVVVLAVAVMLIYNNLIQLKNRVKNAWAQIETQLQRRYDLIPNLVETVKGYAAHESETLEQVTRARNAAVSASTPNERMKYDNMLTGALNRLFALSEAYPDLKANQNFLDLQNQLADSENKISYARQSYNDCVMAYDNALEQFPSNIVAGMFSATFPRQQMFEAVEGAEAAPQVQF